MTTIWLNAAEVKEKVVRKAKAEEKAVKVNKEVAYGYKKDLNGNECV